MISSIILKKIQKFLKFSVKFPFNASFQFSNNLKRNKKLLHRTLGKRLHLWCIKRKASDDLSDCEWRWSKKRHSGKENCSNNANGMKTFFIIKRISCCRCRAFNALTLFWLAREQKINSNKISLKCTRKVSFGASNFDSLTLEGSFGTNSNWFLWIEKLKIKEKF